MTVNRAAVNIRNIRPVRSRRSASAVALMNSSAGFSLVEILVSLALLGVLTSLTYSYTQAINSTTRPQSAQRYNCSAHAKTILSKVISNSGVISILDFRTFDSATGTEYARPPDSTFSHNKVIADNGPLWPVGVPDVLNGTTVGGAVLIDGPMRTLNALYNAPTNPMNAATCEVEISSAQMATLVGNSSSDKVLKIGAGSAPVTKVKIRPYNIVTGDVLTAGCAARDLWVRPRGVRDDTNVSDVIDTSSPAAQANVPNSFALGIATKASANYRADVGFLVNVETTFYEDSPGSPVAGTCVASQRLSYDRDTLPPPAPTLMITTGALMGDGGDANRVNLAFELTENDLAPSHPHKPGTVFLCRDRSIKLDPGPLTCYNEAFAGSPNGPGPQPYGFLDPFNSYYPSTHRGIALPAPSEKDAGLRFNIIGLTQPYYYGGALGTLGDNAWKRCEEVTACGVAVSGHPPVGASPYKISNSYVNAPSDCVMRIEAVAVDVSGNLNQTYSAGLTQFNAVQLGTVNQTDPTYLSTTARPTCGAYCEPDVNWSGQSYWQRGWLLLRRRLRPGMDSSHNQWYPSTNY